MAEEQEKPGRQPIPPNKRRIMQQQFEHGSKSSAKGDWDFANEMFSRCVVGDPSNRMYAESFLGNLRKKYNNDKKGATMSGMRGAGAKGSLKKSSMQKNWPGVIESGVKLVQLNPWDTGALSDMANACREMDCEDTEIVFLRGALEADIKDPEINRLLGRALGRQAQFDQAIICFNRVLQAKPQDEEARRAVADLTVRKTIDKGGYEDAKSSIDVRADKESHQGPAKLTPQQQLEKFIAKNPEEVSKYIELADLHIRDELFEKAEEVYTRAMAASGGGDINLRERLEDVQLRRQRQQVEIAVKRQESDPSEENEALLKRIKVELNSKELEVYRNRCERYPGHAGWKFELGLRLQRAGKYKEAISVFQEARNDPRRKGAVLVAMGKCFLKIDQPKLALSQFEAAIQELSDREVDFKKEALYLAGRVAYTMGDLDKSEGFLTDLAGLDFGYKDVSELLDKLRRKRNKG